MNLRRNLLNIAHLLSRQSPQPERKWVKMFDAKAKAVDLTREFPATSFVTGVGVHRGEVVILRQSAQDTQIPYPLTNNKLLFDVPSRDDKELELQICQAIRLLRHYLQSSLAKQDWQRIIETELDNYCPFPKVIMEKTLLSSEGAENSDKFP